MKISNRLIVCGLIWGLVLKIWGNGYVGILYFILNITIPVVLLFLLFLLVDGKDQSSAVDGEKYYALHLYSDADFCVGDGMSGRAKDMGQKADLTITRRCACTSSNFS